jgi:hypothetical protein
VLTAFALHQWMPAVVGLVALLRVFGLGGAANATGDRGMAWLFATLIVLLSLVATLPLILPG